MDETKTTANRHVGKLTEIETLIHTIKDKVIVYKSETETCQAEKQEMLEKAERQLQLIQNNMKNLELKVEEEIASRKMVFRNSLVENQTTKLVLEQTKQLFGKELENVKLQLETEAKRQTDARETLKTETRHRVSALDDQIENRCKLLQKEWSQMNRDGLNALREQQDMLYDIANEFQYSKDRVKTFLTSVAKEVLDMLKTVKADYMQLQRSLEQQIGDINMKMKLCEYQVESEQLRVEEVSVHNQEIQLNLETLEQTTLKTLEESLTRFSMQTDQHIVEMNNLKAKTERLEFHLNRTNNTLQGNWNTINDIQEKMDQQQALVDDITANYKYFNDRWKTLLMTVQTERDNAIHFISREIDERLKHERLKAKLEMYCQHCSETENRLTKEIQDIQAEKRTLQEHNKQLERKTSGSMEWVSELQNELDKEMAKRDAYESLLEQRLGKTHHVVQTIDEYEDSRYDEYMKSILEWKAEDDRLLKESELLKQDFLTLSTCSLLKSLRWVEGTLNKTPSNCNYADDFKRMCEVIEKACEGDNSRINQEFVFHRIRTETKPPSQECAVEDVAGASIGQDDPGLQKIEKAVDMWIIKMAYFSFLSQNGKSDVDERHLRDYNEAAEEVMSLLRVNFESFFGVMAGSTKLQLRFKTAHIWNIMADNFQHWATKNCTYWNLGEFLADKLRRLEIESPRAYVRTIKNELQMIADRLRKCDEQFGNSSHYQNCVVLRASYNDAYLKKVKGILRAIVRKQSYTPSCSHEHISDELEQLKTHPE